MCSAGVPIFTERERMLLTHIPDYGWGIMIYSNNYEQQEFEDSKRVIRIRK
jgi:hypothetical protein